MKEIELIKYKQKNFKQNPYLNKVNRVNTFWLLREGYRSVNYCYYTSIDHGLSLDHKIPHCF